EEAYAKSPSGMAAVKIHAALLADGNGKAGERKLKEWLTLRPEDVSARMYLAEHYMKDGRAKEAAEHYEILVRYHPGNSVALNNLAWCYSLLNDQRAVQTAERALVLAPQSPEIMDTAGWVLVEAGQFSK